MSRRKPVRVLPPPENWQTWPASWIEWPAHASTKPRRDEVDIAGLADALACDPAQLEPWTEELWTQLCMARLAPYSRATMRYPTARQMDRIANTARDALAMIDEAAKARATVPLELGLGLDEAKHGKSDLAEIVLGLRRLMDAATWAEKRATVEVQVLIAAMESSRRPELLWWDDPVVMKRAERAASKGLTDDNETPRPAGRAIDRSVATLAFWYETAIPDDPLPKKSAMPRKYQNSLGLSEGLAAHRFYRFAVHFLRIATEDPELTVNDIRGALIRCRERRELAVSVCREREKKFVSSDRRPQ